MIRARLAATLVALFACSAPAAADEAVIHVRARLRIDVDGIERAPNGLIVRGVLRDDATDDPVPGRTVAISVDDTDGNKGFYHYAEPTAPDGSFHWRVPLPLGAYRLRIGAGGDTDYVAPTPVDREIDVARTTPVITIHVPERVAAHAPSLKVVVEAHDADGMGPPRAYDDSAWLNVAGRRRTGLTFVAGRAESEELGPFGHPGERIKVEVEIEADDLRNAARASKTVLLTAKTFLTLTSDGDKVSPDALLFVSGKLDDDDGPLAAAGVAIGLEGGADLGHVVTDAAGSFATWIRGRDLPAGKVFLEARYRPPHDWRDAAVSPTVPVEVLPTPPVAVWPYIVSPALTLLAAAVVFAARDRRWRVWLRRRADRRRTAAPPPVAGLTESRPGLLSSLRARADFGLVGFVVDATDDRAIVAATLVVRAGGQTRAAAVDARGRFAVEELPAGPVLVEIAAPGYVGEQFTRTLPHRGELRGARVRLVPVRARIFDAWRRAAAPLYPSPKAAETMTPRELQLFVERRRLLPHDRLTQLTNLVESAVWGPHAPSTADLAEAERLASALKADS